MPRVDITAVVRDCDPDELFGHVARFEAYADIAPNVRSVAVRPGEEGVVISTWEVNFRSGILKWEERDVVDPVNRVVEFAQTEGDLAVFVGHWRVTRAGDEARIDFGAEFDLGIPSLATMLDPAAERTLRKNASELIESFARAAGSPGVRYEDAPDELPRPHAGSAGKGSAT